MPHVLVYLLPSAGREMSISLWASGWRPSVADWGGGMSASCNRWSNCSLMRAVDGRIACCCIISSCQLAATSEIVKVLLVASLTHVRGAIASARHLPLPLPFDTNVSLCILAIIPRESLRHFWWVHGHLSWVINIANDKLSCCNSCPEWQVCVPAAVYSAHAADIYSLL